MNPETGLVALPGERATILEAFKPGTAPREFGSVVGEDLGRGVNAGGPRRGIY